MYQAYSSATAKFTCRFHATLVVYENIFMTLFLTLLPQKLHEMCVGHISYNFIVNVYGMMP